MFCILAIGLRYVVGLPNQKVVANTNIRCKLALDLVAQTQVKFDVGYTRTEVTFCNILKGKTHLGQRLKHKARNVLAPAEGASVGETLWRAALAGGAQALGRDCGAIREGALADLVALDRQHLSLAPLPEGQLIDGWVFAADGGVVREVWSAGRHVVRDGRHIARDAVEASYRAAMTAVLGRM